jgi:hypothetical protein
MSAPVSPIGFGLMCKPPRPGLSKTRLAAGIGAEPAARLSAAFLDDCAAAALEAGTLSPLNHVAYYRPRDGADEIGGVLGPQWQLEFADSGDLGATMRECLAHLLIRCPAGAMIMGADIPMIDPNVIDQAARALRDTGTTDVVIAPTADGGYGLIGVRSIAATKQLFEDISWSTSQVFEQTLARARSAGLKFSLLDEQRDIDDAGDLHWLRATIERHPTRTPATRRALASLALPSLR